MPRVRGIFTPNSISLSPGSRQWGSRYAIRAGRNLPDKELRYLRTVIVTAAVYRGFGRQLPLRSPAPLTYRHRAGVRLYTSSCELAESCVFDKQSLEPILCGSLPLRGRAPLVPRVRGHFAEFLHEGSPERLRMLSAHTCVGFRYGPTARPRGAFRGRLGRGFQIEMLSPLRDGGVYHPDPSYAGVTRGSTSPPGAGILTRCPSAAPLGLALGPD